jgi:hypothetical protein
MSACHRGTARAARTEDSSLRLLVNLSPYGEKTTILSHAVLDVPSFQSVEDNMIDNVQVREHLQGRSIRIVRTARVKEVVYGLG